MTVAVLLGAAVLLAVFALAWVRLLLAAFAWASVALGRGAPSPDSRALADRESGGQGPQGRPPKGVDGRGGVSYYNRPPGFSALAPLAVALQPDWSSFFGGLEAAVAAGGVVLTAVVVVMVVRRFTSF